MSKLYACMISPDMSRDKAALVGVAAEFAHSLEVLDDGVLFDVSGLERLIGKPDMIAQKILGKMQKNVVAGNVAVAETVDTAILLARCQNPRVSKGDTVKVSLSPSLSVGLVQSDMFRQLPLSHLDIERDTLNVFSELGLSKVGDLLAVPHDDLVSRYGREFTDVIDVLEQKGRSFVTPNIKENHVSWSFELDNPVEDFEQLIFLLNHGLERLFVQVDHCGFSTEHLDIDFKLRNKTEKRYEIKTSFPTLDRAFWLKFINLRTALDPPEASIFGVDVTAHFTRPRPAQRGLYAVSRPEPESLLLTVNKLKKLVGEDNVGLPVLLDQRLARPFGLDTDAIPEGQPRSDVDQTSSRLSRPICGEACFTDKAKNDLAAMPPCPKCGGTDALPFPVGTQKHSFSANRAAEPQMRVKTHTYGVIAFNYFKPPIRAEVLVRDTRLVFVKTRYFAGHVIEYSGVWKANSRWWDRSWRTQEWDIEVEGQGVYRLCKVQDEWFLAGEYD
ncbi:MAG: hypothetical protein AB7J13_00535 [Pyrinomonadaceae bacterium]